MITRGGINLDMSEFAWNNIFKDCENEKKAEKILETLSGMSVISAKELLETCKKLIERSIVGNCGNAA